MKNENEQQLLRKTEIEVEINDLSKSLFLRREIGNGTIGGKNFSFCLLNETVPAIIIDNKCYSFTIVSMLNAVNNLIEKENNLKKLESKGEDR